MSEDSPDKTFGTLYLIPTPLGKTSGNNSLPPLVVEKIRSLNIFMVEQMPSAVRFLEWIEHPVPTYEMDFFQLNKHTSAREVASFLAPLKQGDNAGILSEAGAPGVADPGTRLVNMAHSQDIPVVPLVGPSSILLALMASGFNGQSFTFHGYLSKSSGRRRKQLKELEKSSARHSRTELFMETPYRNNELLQDIRSVCDPRTKLCTATSLTLPDEQIISRPVGWWQRNRSLVLGKKPTIFLLSAR